MKAIYLPSLGENIEKGTVVGILVSVGDHLQEGDPIIEVETDKVTVEVPASSGGEVLNILIADGDEVSVGQALIEIIGEQVHADPDPLDELDSVEEPQQESVLTTVTPVEFNTEQNMPASSPSRSGERTYQRATPKARKLARELGVSITDVSSNSASILAADVKTTIRILGRQSLANQIQSDPLPNFGQWGPTSVHQMSGMMKATASNMTKAWASIPHAWVREQVDITQLEHERKMLNQDLGTNLSTTVFIIKAVAHCLKIFPLFNSSIDMENLQIIQKNYYNIGIAVDTDHGLFVPVLKNIDQKGLGLISDELRDVAERAKSKKLNMADLTGSNFTISNLGGIGTTSIFPIINPPEVAILGLGRYQLVDEKKILPMTIAFDHRCINGADAARFLVCLKGLLEVPARLLLA